MSAPAPVTSGGRRLRVVAIVDTTQVSGPARQIAAVARPFAARGAELHVILFRRRGREQSLLVPYLESLGIAYTVLPEDGPFDRALIDRVSEALRTLDADVVETHSYRATALIYALRRRGERWPWVGFFHGATTENLKVRAYHWLDRKLLAAADRVVGMSEQHAHEFKSLGSRVRVVYNAVVPLPANAGAPVVLPPAASEPRPPVIGVIGRLSSEKGVDLFLGACAVLRARGVAFEAVIAGDGPDRAMLEMRRAGFGLERQVHFLGSVANVQSLYAQLGLLVIPSRSEGLPNVLLEALNADVPVVSTRVGAVPEVLTDPAAGEVVPRLDVLALADAIGRALANLGDPAARAARRATADRFSLDRRADTLLALYAEVMPAAAPARDARESAA